MARIFFFLYVDIQFQKPAIDLVIKMVINIDCQFLLIMSYLVGNPPAKKQLIGIYIVALNTKSDSSVPLRPVFVREKREFVKFLDPW